MFEEYSTSAYDSSQTKWSDSFPVRNTETGLTLRAKVDTTLPQVTLYLPKPHVCELGFAVRADWHGFFFFLKSDHHIPRFQVGDTFKRLTLRTSSKLILSALALAASS
jgi:hypothetical protein